MRLRVTLEFNIGDNLNQDRKLINKAIEEKLTFAYLDGIFGQDTANSRKNEIIEQVTKKG